MFGPDLRNEAVLSPRRPGPDLLQGVQIVALDPALGLAWAKHKAGNRIKYNASTSHGRAACSLVDQAFRQSDLKAVCRRPAECLAHLPAQEANHPEYPATRSSTTEHRAMSCRPVPDRELDLVFPAS